MKHCFAAIITLATLAVQASEKPVKVFILAGQSNMVGHGKVEYGRDPAYKEGDKSSKREIPGGIGGLRYLVTNPETRDRYKHLADGDKWVIRDDVWVYSTTAQDGEKGKLTVGFGKGGWFGPELGFGHEVGNFLDEDVLIIKTAWGGHSLGVLFRSPSSGTPSFTRTKFKPEDVGKSYREMLRIVRDVCDNMDSHFPELKGRNVEFAGFGWHQGWNDGVEEMTAEYESNMVNFIKDVRKELGVENLPFVIANTGMIGRTGKTGVREQLCEIQLAVGDPKKHPEFAGTVASVETRDFKRPTELSPSGFGYHWNHNAESHYLVGKSMGEAMVGLLSKGGPKRKYVSRAVLSPEQEKIVLELAAQRGITQVAEISTHNIYPSDARGITVTGFDQIKGREVSNRVLNVQYKDWSLPGQAPGKGDIQIGKFWAGEPFTRKQIILKVAGKEYRISSIDGLSAEVGEGVLGQLLNGKYSVAEGVSKSSLTQIDWSKPQFIRKQGDSISIGFLHKGGPSSGFFDLEINAQKKGLAIQEILQAVP